MTPGTDTTTSERDMCDALTRDGKLHVEDTQGGAVIVVKPSTGTDVSMIRDRARRIEMSISSAGTTTPESGTSQTCALFDIGRQGAMAKVNDSGNTVRLTLTTSDPAKVKDLRRQVRDFVKTVQPSTTNPSGSGTQSKPKDQGTTTPSSP